MNSQLLRKKTMRFICLCRHENAGCVLVDPMDDSRPRDAIDAGQVATAVIQQCIHKCPVRMPRSRMHDHVLRLVDNNDITVFIQNIKRNVLWNNLWFHSFRNLKFNRVAGIYHVFGTRRTPVQQNIFIFDQFLKKCAGILGNFISKILVQPRSSVFCVHSKTSFSVLSAHDLSPSSALRCLF